MTLPACVGLGWRPETAWLIDRRPRIAFSEAIAENIDPRHPPPALAAAIDRGLPVVTHGVALSLGGAEPLDRARLRRLAAVARALRSPLVSEHIAFARAGATELGHFLPVPRTRAQLAILVDNVRRTIDALPVPLALENVAAPLTWPDDQLAEADFLAELLDRTGAHLLLDVANLHANLVNHGGDPATVLARLPLDRIAYLHIAGGARVDTLWRDTHAHPIAPAALDLLRAVLARTGPRPILLERDHAFGARAELEAELDPLEAVLAATPPLPTPLATASPTRSLPAPRPVAADPVAADPVAADPAAADPVAAHAARPALAASQAALARCVVDPALPAPPGFSELHLHETRSLLAAKHARCRAPGRRARQDPDAPRGTADLPAAAAAATIQRPLEPLRDSPVSGTS